MLLRVVDCLWEFEACAQYRTGAQRLGKQLLLTPEQRSGHQTTFSYERLLVQSVRSRSVLRSLSAVFAIEFPYFLQQSNCLATSILYSAS